LHKQVHLTFSTNYSSVEGNHMVYLERTHSQPMLCCNAVECIMGQLCLLSTTTRKLFGLFLLI